MSRNLFGAMAAHVSLETTTLCHCWQINLTNGSVIRITDHDQDLVFLGETFFSDSGFDISMLESGENLAVDNGEITVLYKSNRVNGADVENGLYDGARIRIYLVNWQDTADYTHLPGGFLVRKNESEFGSGVFEIAGLASRANQNVGRKLIPTCDADVGDARCTVNLASFTFSGSVTSSTSNWKFADSANLQADGYFAYGKVTWTSGQNTGVVSEVRIYESGNFTLMNPTPSQIGIGDDYSAHRGCDRKTSTCSVVFDNIENYRGHPFVVGTRDALSGPI